ncbi:MarR family winged helix-turn-helix transcriptional regulator [Nocardia thailandica]|uniref:MarR family winged helix-turn-helix transcriptional regulator n=1 Tax=Nocardia thailandica TaxID=257275 RepID=UPI00031BBC1C|nr:MarR family transcriptional regulator [Nocardia thailandica]
MLDEFDATERRAWSAVVVLAMRLPGALDSLLQREHGLTHFEYRVLSALDGAPDGRMRMGVLAEHGHGSISRLSHVVSKLERMDWARRAAPGSGRGVDVVITPSGRSRVHAATPLYLKTVRELVLGALERPQLAELAELGDRLNEHLAGVLGDDAARR